MYIILFFVCTSDVLVPCFSTSVFKSSLSDQISIISCSFTAIFYVKEVVVPEIPPQDFSIGQLPILPPPKFWYLPSYLLIQNVLKVLGLLVAFREGRLMTNISSKK